MSRPDGAARDTGSVSAEAAVVLPVLVLVLGLVVWGVAAVAGQLACADAAAAAARAAARGDDPTTVSTIARSGAPPGALVTVERGSGALGRPAVTVTVSGSVRPPLLLGHRLPGLSVRASATALREPGG